MNGMVQLGKSMELKVVAEGVETAEQADLLITYGTMPFRAIILVNLLHLKRLNYY